MFNLCTIAGIFGFFFFVQDEHKYWSVEGTHYVQIITTT